MGQQRKSNKKIVKKRSLKKRRTVLVAMIALCFGGYITLHQDNGHIQVSNYKDQRQEIIQNMKVYPEALVTLAMENEETIPFVLDYPKFKNQTNGKTYQVEINKGNIPLFIQWDHKWGYNQYGDNFMAINGCGPTALSMVAVGLTGDTTLTPDKVAQLSETNHYYVDQVGTSWALMTEGAKQLGLKGKELPLYEPSIMKALREGKPIIASMGPGAFTTTGHFIVLTGLTKDHQVIVNDSNSKRRSEQTWDIDVLMNETKNLWVFETL